MDLGFLASYYPYLILFAYIGVGLVFGYFIGTLVGNPVMRVSLKNRFFGKKKKLGLALVLDKNDKEVTLHEFDVGMPLLGDKYLNTDLGTYYWKSGTGGISFKLFSEKDARPLVLTNCYSADAKFLDPLEVHTGVALQVEQEVQLQRPQELKPQLPGLAWIALGLIFILVAVNIYFTYNLGGQLSSGVNWLGNLLKATPGSGIPVVK